MRILKYLILVYFLTTKLLLAEHSQIEPKKHDIDTRIIGGEFVVGSKYDFTATLFYQFNEDIFFLCGGSLIDEKWVITAAHCVEEGNATDFFIQVGSTTLSPNRGEQIGIDNIYIHPDYSSSNIDSDIALLELARTTNISPVKIITEAAQTPSIGTDLTVLGWGSTLSDGSDFSNNLKKAEVQLLRSSACINTYGSFNSQQVICAGNLSGNNGTCNGDSGGPLLHEQENGSNLLIGITSFGSSLGCALEDIPSGYTRVSHYINWIEETTNIDFSSPEPENPEEPEEEPSNPGGGGSVSGGGTSACPGVSYSFEPSISSFDSDKDGFDDEIEILSGTDVFDFRDVPSRPNGFMSGFWTGFLNVINILELYNYSNEPKEANIVVHNIDGVACSSVPIIIPAQSQIDTIINDLLGYEDNSYGLITIETDGGVNEGIDGRVSYYKKDLFDFFAYENVYGLPLFAPNYGETTLNFNTFQPSQKPEDLTKEVYNWLSLINLSNSSQSFTVDTYDINGNLVQTREISIGSRQRRDIDGGHLLLGPNVVGIHVIKPNNITAPYNAFISRYASNAGPGQIATKFSFILNQKSIHGHDYPVSTPITSTLGALNWIEIINTGEQVASADITIYDQNGLEVNNQSIHLNPKAQFHINASNVLGKDKIGTAIISPQIGSEILVKSMIYFLNTDGSIVTAYTTDAEIVRDTASKSIGSYNLFLNMQNWLKLTNPVNQSTQATLTVNYPDKPSKSFNYTLAPYSTLDLDLHNSALFETSPDTFSSISIESSSEGKINAQMLRLRNKAGTQTPEFILPTSVR